MFIISIDLGTTGCKSVVFDEKGRIYSEAYIEYALDVRPGGIVEQDAGQWWELTGKAVCIAVEKAGIQKHQICSVGISSQGIAIVPVDTNFKPLGPAISWLDTRAVNETKEAGSKISSDRLFQITGKRLNPVYTLPKLMWLKKHLPELFRGAYKFLMPQDFILAQLTGRCITDHSMAAGSMLYDVSAQGWSCEILECFGIDVACLPEIRWAGEYAGTIRKEVAQQWGWPETVIVSVGAQDQKAAALGACIKPGVATLSLGTAGSMEFLVERPVFDPEKRLPCFPFIRPDQWILEAVISTSGASLKWLRNTFFRNEEYGLLDRLCEEADPGASGVFFYPHLSGATSPVWNPKLKGMFYGFTLGTSRGEIVRAVLEGIAYQFKSNILVAEDLGCRVDEISIFGGGAKSAVWCQVIADVTGKKVLSFGSPEIANLGAGILAAMAAGFDAARFGQEIRDDCMVFVPENKKTEMYQELFIKYRKIENLLTAID